MQILSSLRQEVGIDEIRCLTPPRFQYSGWRLQSNLMITQRVEVDGNWVSGSSALPSECMPIADLWVHYPNSNAISVRKR